jgi:hypothetical protein
MSEKWELTEHACRICMGRVLVRKEPSGLRIARCAECGATAEDAHTRDAIHKVCACGAKQRSAETGRQKDAGRRCIRNPYLRPELPQEIVVAVAKEGK